MKRSARSAVDLLVVGGGPAGSTMALLAARAGLSVTLIEKADMPRRKVCGEFLSAEGCRALEQTGLLDSLRLLGAVAIDRTRLTHPSGAQVELELPWLPGIGRAALGFSREKLDRMLIEAATEAGVETLQPWRAHSLDLRAGRLRGLTATRVGDGKAREIAAAVIVAADGRDSMLARELHGRSGPPRITHARSRFGLAAQFSRRAPDDGCVGLHLFDGGYAGLAPVEGERQNLALITSVEALRNAGGRPEALLRKRLLRNPALERALAGEIRCSAWAATGPLNFAERLAAAHGVIFIGDAAGSVDPFCGEGISNALCAARLALPFVLEAAARCGVDERLGRRYAAAWKRTFRKPARRAARLAAILERPRLAHPVMRLLAGPGRPIARRLIAGTRTAWSAGQEP